MCLITEQTKAIKIRKDRTVYKVMAGCTHVHTWSKHQEGFCYTFGKLNQTEIKRTAERLIFDEVASEAYGKDWVDNENLISYGQGFHSIESIDRVFEDSSDQRFWLRHRVNDRCVVECVIPKGSLIYEDKTGLLISNQIIINHEVMKAELYRHFDIDDAIFQTTGTHTWGAIGINDTSTSSNHW